MSALLFVKVLELSCTLVLVSKYIETVSVKNVGTTLPSMLHSDDTSILLVDAYPSPELIRGGKQSVHVSFATNTSDCNARKVHLPGAALAKVTLILE
jgi:hypothetical protein